MRRRRGVVEASCWPDEKGDEVKMGKTRGVRLKSLDPISRSPVERVMRRE